MLVLALDDRVQGRVHAWPALPGLVLSVGMAVDSNVLIYERMREEKERGAAMRMVIRNGFGRAMATIIDTHSTTIITGVILYIIGTEQLRGFAVTLVMGLVVNLFTAVFCARVVFDIAERKRWLKELKMLKLFGETKIDFVSIMKPAIVVSILISVAGLFALWERGRTILDVDFTGGSEVQIALNTDKAMDVSAVRKVLEEPSVAGISSGRDGQCGHFGIDYGEHSVHHPHVERRSQRCRSGVGEDLRRTTAALSAGKASQDRAD